MTPMSTPHTSPPITAVLINTMPRLLVQHLASGCIAILAQTTCFSSLLIQPAFHQCMSMATTRPRLSHRVAMFVNPSSRAPRGARLCLARVSSAQCRRYAQSSRPLRPQHALQHALAPPGHAHVCIVFARLVNQYALYGGCQAWHRRKCQT